MAAFIQLKRHQDSFTREIFIGTRNIDSEQSHVEWVAAVKIQSWLRKLKVRKYIRHYHDNATKIQKIYRGYMGRKSYRKIVKEKMNLMMSLFYDQMATVIQAHWRAYYVRKYKFNFYARKAYLDALVIKNETVRLELEKVKVERMMEEETQRLNREIEATTSNNRKHHHLLSTRVCRGIYNSPTKPLTHIETSLRGVSPLSKEERASLQNNRRVKYLKTATGIPTNDETHLQETFQPLPPLKSKVKPQGPFRSPDEVTQQRYKQLQPTLRVATDYQSVDKDRYKLREDEWTKRVIDNSFVPSTKRGLPYHPSLHTTTSYQRPDYGTKHFRETGTSKHIQTSSFRRVVSPIPLFDQLGKTY